MAKKAKIIGAAALSLSALFSASCMTLDNSPIPYDNDNNPPTHDMAGLSRLFNRHSSVPVVFIDRKTVDASTQDSLVILFPDLIRNATGIEPSENTVMGLSRSYHTRSPVAIPNLERSPDGELSVNLCATYAELPGDASKGTLNALMKVDTDAFVNAVGDNIDPGKVTMPVDIAERIIRLHEGFHCIDRWYTKAMYTLIASTSEDELDDHAKNSDFRLQMGLIRHKGEIFADVAAALKIAQEGHSEILDDYAAARAMRQAYVYNTTISSYAATDLSSKSYAMGVQNSTGFSAVIRWPDNIVYIPVPLLTHHTAKGLLAVQDFVAESQPRTIRAITMEDILQKAHEITEAVAPTLDAFRGLSYELWSPVRRVEGETNPNNNLCPACASAITPEQKALGRDAAADYFDTVNRAMRPFRTDSAPPRPRPASPA
ncbi:MAG: hypothetical protein ACXW30_06665 [Micavibrio sp.]